MRSEFIQEIENHLQFLGYETQWLENEEEEDSEYLIARHDLGRRLNWICIDLFGGVQMSTFMETNDYAKENSEVLVKEINSFNANNGPLSFCVLDDVTLLAKMFVPYYERTSFAKLIDIAETMYINCISGGEMSDFFGESANQL